jgi:hypothetical protein
MLVLLNACIEIFKRLKEFLKTVESITLRLFLIGIKD